MRLAVITHPKDHRLRTGLGGFLQRSRLRYQIDSTLLAARWKGLQWFFTDPGQPFRPADAALLHVDMSLIPQDYIDLAARYPKTINGKVVDIRKRHVSRNLLESGSDWPGRVLVKSDLNCRGGPDLHLARRTGQTPALDQTPEYQLIDRLDLVPGTVWADPTRVVERFLPERLGPDYVVRVWSFLGDYERCTWYSATEAVIKAGRIKRFGTSEVPDALRRERSRLGFDYGKFDFAIGPSGPVLFDANRTPAYLFSRPDLMNAVAPSMAAALIALIRG